MIIELCSNLGYCFTWWGLLIALYGFFCLFYVPYLLYRLIRLRAKIKELRSNPFGKSLEGKEA